MNEKCPVCGAKVREVPHAEKKFAEKVADTNDARKVRIACTVCEWVGFKVKGGST